ncbi:MAG: hypothetical protein K1X83_13155 [Oligoflexia bacterium]|nr:hypothetical protein [Oligoflexia bacterium]
MRTDTFPGMKRRVILEDPTPSLSFGYLLIWSLSLPAATLFLLWLYAGNGLPGL